MELSVLEITAVPSDAALARVVIVLNARGVRIRELRCTAGSRTAPAAITYITAVIETEVGRVDQVVAALARVVDVTGVATRSARLSALA